MMPMPCARPLSNQSNKSMKLNGFDSVKQFMEACEANGFKTKKFPYQFNGKPFVVITVQSLTNLPVVSWHLLNGDETTEITSGLCLEKDHFDIYEQITKELQKVS